MTSATPSSRRTTSPDFAVTRAPTASDPDAATDSVSGDTTAQSASKWRAGILGATGAVGQRFVELLADHPWFDITFLAASDRSAGRSYGDVVSWRGQNPLPEDMARLPVRTCRPTPDCDFVFSGLDAEAAGTIEPTFAAAGLPVISNARPFRMHRDVPLLIPDINPDHLALIARQRWPDERAARVTAEPRPDGLPSGGYIVTNPNCSTVGLAIALKPLHDAFGIDQVSVTTLQALSGAGYPGLSALDVLGNVIPYIPGEEEKMAVEPGKILGRCTGSGIQPAAFPVSAQCNRVPVIDGHTLCVSALLGRRVDPDEVADAMRAWRAPGEIRSLPSGKNSTITVLSHDDGPQPVRHVEAGNGMTVTIGRVRRCATHDVKFTALVHNTIRGAAGGAILNAELLAYRGLLPRIPAAGFASTVTTPDHPPICSSAVGP